MWLLLVLHQIITLNTNVLKVFQVTLQLLVRDYYICKKSKLLTSLPPISLPMRMHTQNGSF